MPKHLEEKIDKTHKSDWHGAAGITGWIAMLLPVMSEFENIGEEFFMGVGGASAASVFVIMMKIGRVTAMAGDIKEEHKEHLEEEHEKDTERIVNERERRFESKYLPDNWKKNEKDLNLLDG